MFDTITASPETKQIKSIHPLELFYLFQKLNQRQDISIRIRQDGQADFGNPSTVIRASNSLIMIKDQVSGEVLFLSELRNVSEFVLDKNCSSYKAAVNYTVV